MLLTILLEGERLMVEVDFDKDTEGNLIIAGVTNLSGWRAEIFADASERELNTAIWKAHAEAVAESREP